MLDDQTARRTDAAAEPVVAATAVVAAPSRTGGWLSRHGDVICGCIAAVMVVGAAAYVLSQIDDRIRRLEHAARQTAPIAVVDYKPVMDGLNAGAPPAVLEAAFEGVKALADDYVEAGFVVINAAYVEGAPEQFRVSVPPAAGRELRAAIAAAGALRAAEGVPSPRAAAGSAQGPAGLGQTMTAEEARALMGALQ